MGHVVFFHFEEAAKGLARLRVEDYKKQSTADLLLELEFAIQDLTAPKTGQRSGTIQINDEVLKIAMIPTSASLLLNMAYMIDPNLVTEELAQGSKSRIAAICSILSKRGEIAKFQEAVQGIMSPENINTMLELDL